MPVASSTSAAITKGRGRGRGRWAGDPNPSPGSRTRNVTTTTTTTTTPPPSSPVSRSDGGKKIPPQSSSPPDTTTATSPSRPSLTPSNGHKPPAQPTDPKFSLGTTSPTLKITIPRSQTQQSSRIVHNGENPPPPNALVATRPQTQADPRLRQSRELPQPPSAWTQRPGTAGTADSGGRNTPSDGRTLPSPSQNSRPQESRPLPQPSKVAVVQKSQVQSSASSRPRANGEIPRNERTPRAQSRENGQVVSPVDSSQQKTLPQHSQNVQTVPSTTRASAQNAQTPGGTLPGGDVPPSSINVWVRRAQARNTRSPSSNEGTPPASPRGGGRSPSSGQDTGSPRSLTPSSTPVSPRGRGSEGELPPPPPSPRGKDCSANSDSSADDAELEGLVGLPDRVLMFNKRDPVSVFMEYGQTREVKVGFTEMSRSGPHHASRFHTAAVVDGETHVQATGTSKKNAKKAAAILALRTMYERGMGHLQDGNPTVNRELRELEREGETAPCHGTRVMHVSRRLLEVAEETQFINYSKDKVLATIVLERRGTYTVVGLGTGNRCIQFQNLPTDGSRVIHSHAEIIARRAFIRYILKELSDYRSSEKHALFTRSRHTGLLKLHDDIRVHLYISRPPCGDAAAFPTITNFPNRMRAIRKQGQLRTIIDDGEGAIPTEFQLPANANGKERLRVMTCSDKILRWNAVGIQGALLSNFLDPVYLSSVVIGSHTGDQRGHVPRAVSGRLKCGRLHEVLLKPFRICSPDIVYPPHSDIYAITKSKQYCITWSEGDPDAEVIDAVSGSVAMEPTNDSPSSRVSKRSLLALFRQACHNLRAHNLVSLTYAEAKASARAYQRTKKAVEAHLQNCGFGQWLSLQVTYTVDNFHEDEKL